jgi:hypothetical protein
VRQIVMADIIGVVFAASGMSVTMPNNWEQPGVHNVVEGSGFAGSDY